MFDWLNIKIKDLWTKPKDNTPVAEYNFGPTTRVLVRGAPMPQIGTIISFGRAEITSFGVLHQRHLSENDSYTFPNQCLRWQVTDVEMFFTTSKHDYHYSVAEMAASPHFRVYLAPVADTVNLTNTLPAKLPEIVE